MQDDERLLQLVREISKYPISNISGSVHKDKYQARTKALRNLRELVSELDNGAKEETPVKTSQEQSMQVTIDLYRALTQEYGVGKRHQTSIKDAVTRVPFTDGQISTRTRFFQEVGLMKLDFEFEWQKQKVYWTFTRPAFDGERIIREWFESGKTLADVTKRVRKSKAVETPPIERSHVSIEDERAMMEGLAETVDLHAEPAKQEVSHPGMSDAARERAGLAPVAVHMNGDTPVEAIAGPDAPSPFEALRAIRKDENSGLLEAVRQYAGRKDAIEQSFQQLEKLGIKVDREKALTAIDLETNDYLEGAAALLPYIQTLEAQAAQATNWKVELTETRKERGQLQDLFNREKEANKRLSERMAQIKAAQA